MKMTCAEIAAAVGGSLCSNGGDTLVSGVSTDSRTLQVGELFVPLHGPNYDGHDYLRQAVEHGAAACLSEEVIGALPVPVIQVEDTLQALGEIASYVRAGFAHPVFAITGTSGKTSTKQMLAAVLSRSSAGLKTEGNFNNLIGLPLTVCRLKPQQRWMVLEMGMSQPGEIARLSAIARPDVAIITNIGAGHLSGVGDIAGVARAKGELFDALASGACAVVNNDDVWLRALPLPAGVKKITFAIDSEADVRASDISGGRQVEFTLHHGGHSVAVRLPLPGLHQVYNALAAAAAALSRGVDLDTVVAGLGDVEMVASRLEVCETAGGITILDDSYNANPQSMRAALTTLGDWPCSGRRIAVLADMLELGDAAAQCHREIGIFAASQVDKIVVMGQWSSDVLAGVAAVENGRVDEYLCCADHGAIVDWLRGNLHRDDCVLVKGSRGMRMERVVRQLHSL